MTDSIRVGRPSTRVSRFDETPQFRYGLQYLGELPFLGIVTLRVDRNAYGAFDLFRICAANSICLCISAFAFATLSRSVWVNLYRPHSDYIERNALTLLNDLDIGFAYCVWDCQSVEHIRVVTRQVGHHHSGDDGDAEHA